MSSPKTRSVTKNARKGSIDRDLGMKAILDEMNSHKFMTVDVGVHEGKINGEGLSIAQYGAWNEFGASVDIAARSQQQYKMVNAAKDGYLENGRFVKKSKSNFASWVTIGAYSFTIPERSFMRSTFDENQEKYERAFAYRIKRIGEGKSTLQKAFSGVGMMVQNDIQEKIRSGIAPANAPSTIRKKKSNKTLIDTGALVRSITYEITKK